MPRLDACSYVSRTSSFMVSADGNTAAIIEFVGECGDADRPREEHPWPIGWVRSGEQVAGAAVPRSRVSRSGHLRTRPYSLFPRLFLSPEPGVGSRASPQRMEPAVSS